MERLIKSHTKTEENNFGGKVVNWFVEMSTKSEVGDVGRKVID